VLQTCSKKRLKPTVRADDEATLQKGKKVRRIFCLRLTLGSKAETIPLRNVF
jgi:hypothetical protein